MSTSKPAKPVKKKAKAKPIKHTKPAQPSSPMAVSSMVTPRRQVVLEREPGTTVPENKPLSENKMEQTPDHPLETVSVSGEAGLPKSPAEALVSPSDESNEVAWPSVGQAEKPVEIVSPDAPTKKRPNAGVVVIMMLVALIVGMATYYFLTIG